MKESYVRPKLIVFEVYIEERVMAGSPGGGHVHIEAGSNGPKYEEEITQKDSVTWSF